ncbi:MAG: AsmA-like C-terminal region-containing protein [Bacteroidales bacterium]
MEVKKKRSRTYKLIKWILISILILITLFIASLFLLARYYEEAVKKLFVSELNKRLLTEISVKDIHFTFLKHFPYGTLEFEGLVAKDALQSDKKDTLLQAATLQFHFNILDLYHKKYNIKRIDLEDARLKLKIYKDLSDNFHFWKTPEGPSTDNFSFALEKVVLHKVWLYYSNTPSHQYYSLMMKQVSGKGKFSEDKFDLKLDGSLRINQIRSGSQVLLQKKNVVVDLALAVDQQTGKYTLSKGNVELAGLNFSSRGTIIYSDKAKTLDLHFSTPDAVLSDIIKELPQKYAESLKEYDLKGKLMLEADLTGNYGGKDLPLLDTRFSVEKGSITYSKENISLENLSFSGLYRNFTENGSRGNKLIFKDISGSLNKGDFSAELEILGFGPSEVKLSMKADLDISELLRFIPDEKINAASGNFKLRMNYSGNVQSFEDFNSNDFTGGQFACELDLNSFTWEMKDQPYRFKDFNGALTFNNNDVQIHKIDGSINNNTFAASGYFRNMVPFLLSETEELHVKASLSSPALNLKDIFIENTSGSEPTFTLLFPERWTGEVSLSLGKLEFKNFHGEKVKGNLRYAGRKLFVNQLSFNTAGGGFSCDASIDGTSNKYFDIAADVRLKKVNINRLFYNFGNFGQDYLVDENLKGIVSSDIQCSFRMSQKLEIDPSTIIASIDTYIEEGELINYQAITGLGKFIRVDDLSRVKFSTLNNTVYIKNKMVIIPSMDVVSDALNFTMSGTHSFNNELNYHFRLLLSDILWKKARKAKKENEEFGIEQEEESGKTTLFILLTGTVDKPVFKYDSKSLKGKIVSSFLNEKASLKESLKKEFSRTKKEQDSLTIREEHILKQQEDGKFVIDWENSLGDSLAAKKKEIRKIKKPEKKKEKSEFKVEWEEDPQK